MVLGIDEKFFGKKNGFTSNYFFQKIGATQRPGWPEPNKLVIRGYSPFFEKIIRYKPTFFPKPTFMSKKCDITEKLPILGVSFGGEGVVRNL